jgi:hypothetical protein
MAEPPTSPTERVSSVVIRPFILLGIRPLRGRLAQFSACVIACRWEGLTQSLL